MNHTKGEWVTYRAEGSTIYVLANRPKPNVPEFAICRMIYEGGNEKANAYLIAAAPDLYMELVTADRTICELCVRLNLQHENCTSCADRESRQQALAKAEGK